MNTKKKQKKNEDFKKVKLKVGKKLKKTSTTDTTFKTKKVVISSQLQEKTTTDEKPLSFRGLTLDELSRQLGHFNQNIRKDAMTGIKQLLTSRPDLIATHLRTLIPSIAKLIGENNRDDAQLKSLLQLVCTAPSDAMSAHISLFLAHVYRSLSHMEVGVRNFSLSILRVLMTSYPDLCQQNADLFPSFVNFLSSSRRPAWNAPKFLETIVTFLNVYDISKKAKSTEITVDISFEKEKMTENVRLCEIFTQKGSPFDFPVTGITAASAVSPFELPESLIKLAKVLSPILTTSILDDVAGAFLNPTVQILTSISDAMKNQPNSFLVENFEASMKQSLETVRKAIIVKKGKSKKLRTCVDWLLE